MRKYSLYGFYIIYSVLFLLGIYLSVVHTPTMRATILLGFFCIMPFSFIDRPIRMNLFAIFWFVVHTLLAFYLKPDYALHDTINCLCLGIFSCFLGNIVVRVRLESYETLRLLTLEKETDVLTGLPNRRKLFETLEKLEITNEEKPSAIMMIDIDHFKELNDTYGHAAGDKCLINFGKLLNNYIKNYRLQFYRYGGEEFVALAYGYSATEIYSVAESLRTSMQNTDINGQSITVSIGISYCEQEQVKNYEKVIARADQAVYSAKRAGRNRVYMEEIVDRA